MCFPQCEALTTTGQHPPYIKSSLPPVRMLRGMLSRSLVDPVYISGEALQISKKETMHPGSACVQDQLCTTRLRAWGRQHLHLCKWNLLTWPLANLHVPGPQPLGESGMASSPPLGTGTSPRFGPHGATSLSQHLPGWSHVLSPKWRIGKQKQKPNCWTSREFFPIQVSKDSEKQRGRVWKKLVLFMLENTRAAPWHLEAQSAEAPVS